MASSLQEKQKGAGFRRLIVDTKLVYFMQFWRFYGLSAVTGLAPSVRSCG